MSDEQINKLCQDFDRKQEDALRAFTVAVNGMFSQLHADRHAFYNGIRATVAANADAKKPIKGGK